MLNSAADYIQELEDDIAAVEAENLRLASELTEKLSEQHNLDESTVVELWSNANSFDDLENKLQRHTHRERRPKKSFVADQLEGGVSYNLNGEINETNTFAQEKSYDPRMAPYMRYFR